MKQRHTVGRSRMTPKKRLLMRIRNHKSAATVLRLRGLIGGALRYEEELDRERRTAQTHGWSNDAADAEERGVVEGHKAYMEHYK